MKNFLLLLILGSLVTLIACEKEKNTAETVISDEISIDSMLASVNPVKAWDTTTITCYAGGADLVYQWECDHGNFNGNGNQIKYTAGQCCVGVNTIKCTVSNNTGQNSKEIQIQVTSYFEGGK